MIQLTYTWCGQIVRQTVELCQPLPHAQGCCTAHTDSHMLMSMQYGVDFCVLAVLTRLSLAVHSSAQMPAAFRHYN